MDNANCKLQKVIQQIFDELRVDSEGKGTATIRATARILGIDEKSLRKTFKSANFSPSKLAQSLAKEGFDVRTFALNGIPDLAIAVIVEYYAFDAGKRCTEQAMLAYRSFGAIGVRAWIQDVTGYRNKQQQLLEAVRVESRLGSVDAFAEYRRVMAKWLKRHPEKKSGMWSYHQHCQNGINRKLTGATAHGIEKHMPILFLAVKRDYYQTWALNDISLILMRFCEVMEKWDYDFDSPVEAMKLTLRTLRVIGDVSVDSILIEEAEARAIADVMAAYPDFDYEDFVSVFEEHGTPRVWANHRPLKQSRISSKLTTT